MHEINKINLTTRINKLPFNNRFFSAPIYYYTIIYIFINPFKLDLQNGLPLDQLSFNFPQNLNPFYPLYPFLEPFFTFSLKLTFSFFSFRCEFYHTKLHTPFKLFNFPSYLLLILFENFLSFFVLIFISFDSIFCKLLVLFRDDFCNVCHLFAWIFIFNLLVNFLLVDEEGTLRTFRRCRLYGKV